MGNFGHALKLTLRHRLAVAGTLICSLLVAVLWGGNIGALYPVIQVAFQGRSLQSWIGDEVRESRATVDEIRQRVAAAEETLAANPTDYGVQDELALAKYDLNVERQALAVRQRLLPYIEKYMPSDPFRTVALIVGVLTVATMVKGFMMYLNAMFVSLLEQRTAYDLRRTFYHWALKMDLASFGQERTSGLLSHFNTDIGVLTAGIKALFGSAIREPMKMIACLLGASYISWRLLLFSLVLAPLIGFLVQRLAGSIKRANRRVLDEVSQLYGVLTETFNGIQTVQAYTLEQQERRKFQRVSRQCFEKSMRIAFYNALTKPLTEVMGIAMISLALLAGAYLSLNHETHLLGLRLTSRPLDVPSLLVFYGLLIGAIDPARRLSEVFSSIQGGLAAADRLFPLLEQQPSILSPSDPITCLKPHRQIEFDNVGFHYTAGTPVLNRIKMTVEFGETIAVVGPNGCGKSTLIQMLPRFFDPIDGAVRIDGVDLRQMRLRDLRQRIGLVTQQSLLFDDTVFNNIQCGKADATEDEVIRAAKQARAHKFIVEKLHDGYQTNVGAGGSRLSGGQRQRVALARAILRDPEILILDEATSQIDLESEQLIHQALQEFARGRTVFMITHRMSILSLASRILVMNHGRVEDLGSHQELINRCALYQRLYALQFQKSA